MIKIYIWWMAIIILNLLNHNCINFSKESKIKLWFNKCEINNSISINEKCFVIRYDLFDLEKLSGFTIKAIFIHLLLGQRFIKWIVKIVYLEKYIPIWEVFVILFTFSLSGFVNFQVFHSMPTNHIQSEFHLNLKYSNAWLCCWNIHNFRIVLMIVSFTYEI